MKTQEYPIIKQREYLVLRNNERKTLIDSLEKEIEYFRSKLVEKDCEINALTEKLEQAQNKLVEKDHAIDTLTKKLEQVAHEFEDLANNLASNTSYVELEQKGLDEEKPLQEPDNIELQVAGSIEQYEF